MALEEEMRSILQAVGAKGPGKVLSKQEEGKQRQRQIACPCGKAAGYVRERTAKLLSVFGWVSYHGATICPHIASKGSRPWIRRWGCLPGK